MAFVTIEERVDRLEAALGQLITQMAVSDARAEERNRLAEERFSNFQKEMLDFKNEMLDFKNEMLGFKDEMLGFKDEMLGFKDEMLGFKDEMREDRRLMNKQWGELANKMGTMVEDIVAPSVRGLAERELGLGSIQQFMVRVARKNPNDKRHWQEFDVLVIGEEAALVTSVKSKIQLKDDLAALRELQKRFRIYFPEYAHLQVVGILASLYLPEEICEEVAKAGFYGLAMGDDCMEIVARPMMN